MTAGPDHNERQAFDDMARILEPGRFQTIARMLVAYDELDAEIHRRTNTEHNEDEMIAVDEYQPMAPGEAWQRSVVGINDSEIYVGMPLIQGAPAGRSVFIARFADVDMDSPLGKHLDQVVEPLVVATTLEDLADTLRAGRARARIEDDSNKH